MLFNSIGFAIFCPLVIIIYFYLEKKSHRAALVWLLLSDYFYYMCADVRFGALLFAVTLITYLCGRVCGNSTYSRGRRRAALIMGCIANVGLLIFFKYFNLFEEFIMKDDSLRIVLPVGVSFYVFSSLTYVIDTYRGEQAVQKDFVKYALFVSFFPTLLAGPIERSVNLLPQFDNVHGFDYERTKSGLVRMACGYFMKLVIAQRLAITVDLIYGNVADVSGFLLLLATVMYAFQIYCDFASYSSIAKGVALIMGFDVTDNFAQPFFAHSVANLWRRWHVSLNNWFINYVYIPLGGSKRGKLRKYINTMAVFTLSGMWHGAAGHYVIWGMLSGFFQVMGDVTKPFRERVAGRHQTDNKTVLQLHGALQILVTFACFVIALVFFRAESTGEAFTIFGKIFGPAAFSDIASFSIFDLGLGVFNMIYLLCGLALLVAYDVINERTGDAPLFLATRPTWMRWCIYYAMILMILGSAALGAKQFIYFEF
ncbi:MAG: MBOAT family protein [Lachnospiraceae bacterium]|nr:MBOAT family protein [Lachnospiraceae bacterium]